MFPVFNITILKGGQIKASVFLHFILTISDRFTFSSCLSVFLTEI